MSAQDGTGKVLLPDTADPRYQGTLPVATTDARNAAAIALAEYLEAAVFRVYAVGTRQVEREFSLTVLPEWPRANAQLPYPAASIVDSTAQPYQAHSFTPTPLEDTLHEHVQGAVLWKLAEAAVTFQVDFWTNTVPDREAIAAALPGLFAPGETAYRVVLQGPPSYWCLPVRVSLLDSRRMDDEVSVESNERRLMATIRAEVDVVEARYGTVFTTMGFRLEDEDPENGG